MSERMMGYAMRLGALAAFCVALVMWALRVPVLARPVYDLLGEIGFNARQVNNIYYMSIKMIWPEVVAAGSLFVGGVSLFYR